MSASAPNAVDPQRADAYFPNRARRPEKLFEKPAERQRNGQRKGQLLPLPFIQRPIKNGDEAHQQKWLAEQGNRLEENIQRRAGNRLHRPDNGKFHLIRLPSQ